MFLQIVSGYLYFAKLTKYACVYLYMFYNVSNIDILVEKCVSWL